MSAPSGMRPNLKVFTMLNALAVQTTDEKALTLHEAAERLNVSYSTIFSYRKELGFQLRARGAWRIWPSRLAAFSEKKNNVTQLSLRVLGEAPCPSAKMKPQVSGKLISASQASRELDALLEHRTGKPRRNITTS
ncbi:hypothetical protein D3C87_1100790 [compost metagenome]|uniref:hypothetical protein n=1 Tax=unclassified Achromobacter TaxID=2626865 RepID=UPI000FBB59A2|nr:MULTISPECIES: hypothetical protein [unclassified Achromobacter]